MPRSSLRHLASTVTVGVCIASAALTAPAVAAPAPMAAVRVAAAVVGGVHAAPAGSAAERKRAAAKKAAAKKAAARRAAAQKAASKKAAAKRTSAKKAAAHRAAPKKIASKKAAPKKAAPAAKAPAKPGTAVFTSRVTAHPAPVKDSRGRVWAPLPANWGTRHVSRALAGTDMPGTNDDVLYQANAWDARGYELAVPAPATYRVTMHFADDFATRAGQRVFDVKAEGRTVVSKLDIAGAVGHRRPYSRTFTTRVTDGTLDLTYVKRADLPLVSAIEVTSTTPVAKPTTAPQAVRLAPGNVFATSVRNAPLAPDSRTLAAGLAAQVRDHWGGTAAVNAYSYNVGFNTVGRGTPKVRIGFHDCQHKGSVPAGLYDGPAFFKDVPMPASPVIAPGRDGQVTVYDPSTDKVWEFWQMRRNTRTNGWEACWGGRVDAVSTKPAAAFQFPYGASASGLAIASGMVSLDDLRRNRIDHAMTLAVIDAARWDQVSWPANRSDGIGPVRGAIMEGQRVRLDPKLDLNRFDLTPFGRLVAEAAQEYGFIVTDRSGAVAISTQSGGGVKARTGADPWDRYLGGPSYDALKNFPWEHAQVLPPNYGRPRG